MPANAEALRVELDALEKEATPGPWEPEEYTAVNAPDRATEPHVTRASAVMAKKLCTLSGWPQ